MAEQDTMKRPVAEATLPSGPGRAADPGSLPMELGERIGSCVLRRVLGRGGMGVVYEAHDEALDRRVAVKLLSIELARDERLVQRFQREARSMAKMGLHPNIVHVYSAGAEGSTPHLVMEFVEGEDVAAKIAFQALAVEDALRYGLGVAKALAAAHAQGILHRDIKPSNVMVSRAGDVKVLDFGLAKVRDAGPVDGQLTQAAEVMGSPHYMSPEQAKGQAVDARSDVYSLGATLYHMLAGRPPYDDTSLLGILHKHATSDLPPLRSIREDVPSEVEQLVSHMMAKDPARRLADGGAVVTAIEELQGVISRRRELGRLGRVFADTRALIFRGRWSWDPEPAPAGRVLGLFFAIAVLGGILGVATKGNTFRPPLALLGRPTFMTLLAVMSWAIPRQARVILPMTKVIHLETCLLLASFPLWVLPGHPKVQALVNLWFAAVIYWRGRAYRKLPGIGKAGLVGLCVLGTILTVVLTARK